MTSILSDQAIIAQKIYTPRAPKYNESWHPSHALALVNLASLSPGQHVLDLCCGTGLVSVPAAKAVGPSRSVTGIDITDAMLSIARSNSESDKNIKAPINYINHDVLALDTLVNLRQEGYDIITAASALPLMPSPGEAIKHWSQFLTPGGKLIIDVPTERGHVRSLIFEEVCRDVGSSLPYGRAWIKGKETLEKLFEDAGLVIEKSVEIGGFDGIKDCKVEEIGGLFDSWVSMIQGLGIKDESMLKKARAEAVRTLEARAVDGVVKEGDSFYVVVGRK